MGTYTHNRLTPFAVQYIFHAQFHDPMTHTNVCGTWYAIINPDGTPNLICHQARMGCVNMYLRHVYTYKHVQINKCTCVHSWIAVRLLPSAELFLNIVRTTSYSAISYIPGREGGIWPFHALRIKLPKISKQISGNGCTDTTHASILLENICHTH